MTRFSTCFYRILPLFSLLIINGCSKIVNIDIPPVKSKPVIYALVASHQPVQLYFDKSFGILEYVDSNQMYSTKAVVNLYVNHRFKERLAWGKRYFQSYNFLPGPSDTLSVEVIPQNGTDTLFAQTHIPQKVKIDTAWLADSVYKDRDGDYYSQINLRFKDPPRVKNYYEIFIRAKCRVNGKIVSENIEAYYSDNPAIVNEGLIGSTGQIENDFLSDRQPSSVIFSDTLFQGKEMSLGITFLRPCEYVTGHPEAHSFSLSVYLSNVTKVYYQYRKTMFMHLNAQQSNLWDGYVEPIQMFSNVKGGYGVFAGYTPDSVIFHVR
jgi:hypothetical protein